MVPRSEIAGGRVGPRGQGDIAVRADQEHAALPTQGCLLLCVGAIILDRRQLDQQGHRPKGRSRFAELGIARGGVVCMSDQEGKPRRVEQFEKLCSATRLMAG